AGRLMHRERKYNASLTQVLDFHWDGDDRLRKVRAGGVDKFIARYDESGLRAYKNDAWTGDHWFTWGLEGVVNDSYLDTRYTPGLLQRRNGVDRFFHSDWLGSTRHLSDSTGSATVPSSLRYDAFGNRSAWSGSDGETPTDFQFAGGWGYQQEYQT